MKRRWHRIVIPFAVVLVLIGGTVLIRWLSEPDYGDPQYISPVTAGDTSAIGLANTLRDKGITVRRETDSARALEAVWSMGGKATLFIPAPEFVHENYLFMLRQSPPGTRIVLVEPSDSQLFYALPLAGVANRRWATAATAPGANCPLTTAGKAGVTRSQYGEFLGVKATETATYCYDHGLMLLPFKGVDFVVAGSPEPFRGDRMSENDNARLAVDLLSTRPTVVWIDRHSTEAGPKTFSEANPPAAGKAIPSVAPGNEVHRDDASPRPKQSVPPKPKNTQARDISTDPPSRFPPWVLPLFLTLGLAVLALMFARGRRLGAPAIEPLPIEVRGAETAIGRSRLYRKAKARGAALDTLRLEARRRIALVLRLPAAVGQEQLLDALTSKLGQDREHLTTVLYGPAPETDAELENRTTELLRLVEQVTRNGKENK